ncbi:hypothetical protein Slin15195_G104540 [Septoria linicola]|uniref:Nephrocystin 3-like N-terminal domain-containing protein n=1 Tax=Septoria linicola TaxID=215465 RepID=A0A9Q9ENK0_9PEZI|nr:hypothetical protein Slin14017_G067580 [Septoria linicola]USW57135.1 hypothetical protein Slin15195_G104540 [Septoria linicola]
MRKHYELLPSVGFAIFFFSFANPKKQSVEDMLLALIAQLARKASGLAVLTDAYRKYKPGLATNAPLEDIYRYQLEAMSDTVVLIDALDECPGTSISQHKLLQHLERLAASTRKLRLFVTSRDELLIRATMTAIQATTISIEIAKTNHDIERFVSQEFDNDTRLKRFDEASRTLIQSRLAEKADGM